MQIFELDGYLRLRSDYMHQFFLGQGYYAPANSGVPGINYGLPPFPVPLDKMFERTAELRGRADR